MAPQWPQKLQAAKDKFTEWRKAHGLNLTEDQKTQMRAIMQKAREDAGKATTREDKVKIFKDAWEQAKKLLTPEQVQKLAELRQKGGLGMMHHGLGAGHAQSQPAK